MADLIRYELEIGAHGAYIWDRQEQRFLTLASSHVSSVENIIIDAVEYLLHADEKSLIPVPPEGRVFQ